MVGMGKEEEGKVGTFGVGGSAGVSGWVAKAGAEMGSRIGLGSGREGIGPKIEGSGWIKRNGENGPKEIRF